MKCFLYHGHDWEWNNTISTNIATYNSNAVYFTDDPEYAKEFGEYVDLCEVAINNPYVLEDNGGFLFNDNKPLKIDGELAWIGDVCDYDFIPNTLINRGFDSVLEYKDSFYIVVVLNPKNIKILQKDIH